MTMPAEKALEIIARVAAMPRDWRVTTRYADGRVRTFDTRSEASANNHAITERRKIGRNLVDRETGATVRVVEVEVGKIQK